MRNAVDTAPSIFWSLVTLFQNENKLIFLWSNIWLKRILSSESIELTFQGFMLAFSHFSFFCQSIQLRQLSQPHQFLDWTKSWSLITEVPWSPILLAMNWLTCFIWVQDVDSNSNIQTVLLKTIGFLRPSKTIWLTVVKRSHHYPRITG